MNNYTLRDFMPLIVIFFIVIILTSVSLAWKGWDLMYAMNNFMAFFFIVFGSFKVINLSGFVEAYQMYDIIAQRSTLYAFAYPFIELLLGISYLMQWLPFATNLITLTLMTVSSIGVFIKLREKETIPCACLGAVFKVPMTWVTLLEDLLMAAMALFMLSYLY